MRETEKKEYTAPVLTIHGDVEDVTQNSSYANRDAPSGNNNSAYPNS